MEKLTVGYLENELRKFPKGTEIMLTCGCCHNGSSGHSDIIGIRDNTNQTFGYIELNVNNTSKPNVALSKDKEEFYKIEISKLENQRDNLEHEIFMYKNHLESIHNISKSGMSI